MTTQSFRQTYRQFNLATARTSYVVSLLPDGSGLLLDSWGEATETPLPPAQLSAHPQHEITADVAPLEYATNGTRHGHFCELVAHYPTGVAGSRWQVDEAALVWSTDGTETTLDVPFDDETRTLRLVQHLRTSTEHDVVRRWVTLSCAPDGTGPVELTRCFSAGWALPVGPGAVLDYLAGEWAREFSPQQVRLGVGSFSIGSRRGFTGLDFAPNVSVSALTDDGRAYGVALAFSGSWRINVEAVTKSGGAGNRVRVSAGVDDQDTVIRLSPGETFVAPESHGVFSADGVEGVRQAWHHFQRTVLARDLSPATRPIVYNSWYATEFDVRPEHQAELAEVAAELGAEVFVVDDGWMPRRVTDGAGLGEWWPDPERFPEGLAPLVDAVISRGMRFGIWVELEGVNPDSDLYRAHPDWVYRAGDRPYVLVRNQLLLDFGRPEVVEWAKQSLRDLLEAHPISYLKWDMNRPISDGGRPGDPHGREWAIQHARGYYDVLDMLRAEYPHVTIEACASGGGRIDHGVLARTDVVWTSDETGPLDRLRIQDGFLRAYGAHVMSSWVTDEAGQDERTPASLGYRFVVAMAGVLGIGSDLLGWDGQTRQEAGDWVALYASIREVIQTGRVRVHGQVGEPGYALEYAGAPGDPDRVVLLVYDVPRNRVDREVRIRPYGLQAGRRYRLAGTDQVVEGAAARGAGIVVNWRLAPDADVLVFEPVA